MIERVSSGDPVTGDEPWSVGSGAPFLLQH